MQVPPKISVVIPLYNKERYIQSTLRSVLDQSWRDFEVIVVDDGSTDGGAGIVGQFDDPRIILFGKSNEGVAAARNTGIARSRAEYVAFLDADDIWRPRHLEILLGLHERFPGAVLVGNTYIETAGDDCAIADMPIEYRLVENYYRQWVQRPRLFCTSSCMVQRSAALAAGGYPAPHFRGEDLAFYVNLAMAAPFAVGTYVGCLYRRTPGGLTSRPLTEPDICMQTILKILAANPALSPDCRQSLQEFYYNVAMGNALSCLDAGYPIAARTFISLAAPTIEQRRRWRMVYLLSRLPEPLRRAAFALRKH